MKTKLIILGLMFVVLCSFSLGYSAVPQMINYQGKITTPGGALVDTTVQMIFTIYDDSTTGNILWADTVNSVSVQKGIFSVLLGSGNPIPDSVFDGDIRYLGTKVGADVEMSPRKEVVSVAYAFRTAKVDTAEYAISSGSDGDWDIDTAGINVYRLTGNVGIGMPVPQYKLDVGGTAQVTGFKMSTGAGIGKVLTSDANGVGTWQTASGGGGGWVDDGNVVRLQTSTDSVGIGTSSPGAPLQIGSGSHVPVFLNTDVQIDHDDFSSHRMEIRNSNGATGWSIDASGTTTFGPISATKDLYLLGGNSVRMTIDGASGDVGIGTTSPDAPLQVGSGTHAPVLVNTSVQIDHNDASDHNVEIRNNSGATGWRINASGSTTFGPLSVGQDLYLLGGNSTRMTIDGSSGNVGIGITTPGANLDIVSTNPNLRLGTASGSPVITLDKASGGYSGYLEFREAGASKWQAGVSTTNDYYILNWPASQYVFFANSAGDVGIGTTSPSEKLTVNGDIDMIQGQSRIHGTGEMSFDWSAGSTYDNPSQHGFESKDEAGTWGDEIRINSMNDIINTVDANGNDATSYFKVQHHSTGDGEDLFWVRSSDGYAYLKGRLGIGTTGPGVDLDIVSANPNLRLSTTSGSPVITLDKASGYWGYLEFRDGGASKWQAGVTNGNDYYILNWPASKYVFYANSAGNVGIGTTSPTGPLDVNGNDIRIRTSQTPASASADGYTGEIAWDGNYIYICVSGDGPGGSTDSWKRAALSTW